jgi:putative nucleotidyltransferase with HDIG domain
VERRRGLQAYIVGVGIIAAGVLIGMAIATAAMPEPTLAGLMLVTAIFVLLGWIGGSRQALISESSTHTMGTAASIAAILTLPFPIAILSIALSKTLAETYLLSRGHARSWRAFVVNSGGAVIANASAGGAYHALRGDQYLWNHGVTTFLAFPSLLALVGTYDVMSVLVVTGAITLSSKERPGPVFLNLTRGVFYPETSLIFVGIVLAVIWHLNPILSLIMVVPLVLSVGSFESAARLKKETVEAVLRMAESIDYRDTGTYDHSRRLASLTRSLGLSVGLTPEHVEEIVLASYVHDLGKIGVSNEILFKNGPLTPEEKTIMEEHPVIGANILESYSAFAGSVDIVKHHHERWDGNGYPDGLKSDQIPVGSRVITIVDSFDSMTADRPYRDGMSVDEAMRRLKDGLGTQFDPTLCAVFINLLIEDGTYRPSEPPADLRLVPVMAGRAREA